MPLTIVRARPIGPGFVMRDDKGVDDKIVAVAVDDPAFAHYQRHDELPPHVALELMRFFSDYKVLEKKLSEVEDLYDRERAHEVIEGAIASYRQASLRLVERADRFGYGRGRRPPLHPTPRPSRPSTRASASGTRRG